MFPFGFVSLIIVLWIVWRKKTQGKVRARYIALNVCWVCYLLAIHGNPATWSFSLAKKLFSEGSAAAAAEFQLEGDFGFGPLGMFVLLGACFLSLAAEFLGVMLVARNPKAKEWVPRLVVPLYLLDWYLLYFVLARRAEQPTTMADFFRALVGFSILFAWLYVFAWQAYRTNELDPLFVSWSESSSTERQPDVAEEDASGDASNHEETA